VPKASARTTIIETVIEIVTPDVDPSIKTINLIGNTKMGPGSIVLTRQVSSSPNEGLQSENSCSIMEYDGRDSLNNTSLVNQPRRLSKFGNRSQNLPSTPSQHYPKFSGRNSTQSKNPNSGNSNEPVIDEESNPSIFEQQIAIRPPKLLQIQSAQNTPPVPSLHSEVDYTLADSLSIVENQISSKLLQRANSGDPYQASKKKIQNQNSGQTPNSLKNCQSLEIEESCSILENVITPSQI
jgi:hypothetical protein